jgi:nitrate/nitrite-specific signal transduction histidine kinase
VKLDLRTERRLPDDVEVAAYYVVSEALTNAAKHAHASVVTVELEAGGSTVHVAIRDDGVGGADPARGSGLVGRTIGRRPSPQARAREAAWSRAQRRGRPGSAAATR